MTSASLTIMGVAVTITVKRQFCKTQFLLVHLVDLVNFINSNLMTASTVSRCIYLLLQLLAKKTVRLSIIYDNFKMKHFYKISHLVVRFIWYP